MACLSKEVNMTIEQFVKYGCSSNAKNRKQIIYSEINRIGIIQINWINSK